MTTVMTQPDEFSVPVDHVSDTAYLVAAFRLIESKRPDRHFDDSIAAKLLGDKTESIFNRLSMWKLGEWTMAVRTTLIDRTILKLIQDGLDTVVNLAAGLDTRPYRLALPPNLNWIEADLEGIIQFKNKKLEADRPVCRLKRVQVDLANPQERSSFFSTFKDLGRFAVLTEGLLLYLDPQDVQNLSKDLLSYPNLKAWLVDITTATSMKLMHPVSENESKLSPNGKQVHFRFLPDEGVHYFEPLGWKVKEFQSYYEYGKILNRNFPSVIKESDLKDICDTGLGTLIRNTK